MPINNQQYRGEIGVFNNKIRVIKWYYNFLDFQKSSSTKVFDFESLLMALDSLASFHFESLVYYVTFILQCTRRVNFCTLTSSYIFQVLVFSHIYFYSRLTELSGDFEKHPGPKSKPDQSFSICHWNLSSIVAHNCSKIKSLIACNCIHHFDIICLSETYLNSDISFDNENFDIQSYRLVLSDYPSNDERDGVCVYFKSSLPIQTMSISMLHECINLKITIDVNLVILYVYIGLQAKRWKNLKRL